MKTALLLLLAACAFAAEPPKTTGTTDVAAKLNQTAEPTVAFLQAELSQLKAQLAWCTTELNIWSQNPDIVQVRLNLMLESRKAEERQKAQAKEKK